MKVARVYLRVSTEEQDITRQTIIEQNAREAGYYIAGTYREKASGARVDYRLYRAPISTTKKTVWESTLTPTGS